MALITIIGRGHSGTRTLAHTLYASNVFMGRRINPSGDLVPPDSMYDACRVLAKYVKWQGDLRWSFGDLQEMEVDPAFTAHIQTYLASVLASPAEHKGWKIPETTLVLPWIIRLFPDARYVYWIRNPRDCILQPHVTDDLSTFGVPGPQTSDVRLRRAISWKYQHDLMAMTPKPRHWLEVRFEDFVLSQEETLARLETFLGFPLARVVVRRDSVARYKTDPERNYFDFFEPAMRTHGYDLP